jgi:hypothetical protein
MSLILLQIRNVESSHDDFPEAEVIHSCYRFFPEHFVSFLESHGTIILKGKERRCHEIREFGRCNGTF